MKQYLKMAEEPEIVEVSAGIRQIIIETDGLNIKLVKTECSQLELKEICREIIDKLTVK